MRTKSTWNGAISDGVCARSRMSKMVVSARSRSWRREVARVSGGERGEDALAAALVEEGLVAEQDVAGAERGGRGDLGEEAVGRGEARAQACEAS